MLHYDLPTYQYLKNVSAPITIFQGTIDMLDYHAQRPIKLQVDIHEQKCAKEGKLAVFVSVSPQPASHNVWTKFKFIRDNFKCGKP